MPEKDFIINTEYDLYSRVLILDDSGELPTILVDLLLNHGCIVYYYGVESRESFYYLEGKRNFIYLNNNDSNDFSERVDYCIYFFKEKFEKREIIFDLSKKHKTKFLFCGNLSLRNTFQEEKLLEQKDLNARAVFYDCLYGPRITNELLGDIFLKSVNEKEITIGGSEEKIIYPVYSESLAKEVLKIIFSGETDNKSFFIYNKKMELGSFVKLVNNYFNENQYKFENTNNQSLDLTELEENAILEEDSESVEKTYQWFVRNIKKNEQAVPVEDESASILNFEEKATTVENIENKQMNNLGSLFDEKKYVVESIHKENLEVNHSKKPLIKKITFGLKIFFVLIFVFYFIPAMIIVISGYFGLKNWNSFQSTIEQGKYIEAIVYEKKIEKNLLFIKRFLTISGPFYSISGLEKQIETLNDFIDFTQKINNSSKYYLFGERELVSLGEKLISGQTPEWKEKSNSINSDFSLAYQEASLAQTILPKTEKLIFLLGKNTDMEKYKKDLEIKREQLLKTMSLINTFPNMFGSGGRKTYILLIQNNLELRPTGGFIGAYGIINVENGRLINFEVLEVYKTDGQLKGKVEPPEKIKQLLGEKVWYFRDSNWSPDFPTSAQKAEWFLDKETQLYVDGVFAVNLNIFQKILLITGGVTLSDQQTVITADNLLIKAQTAIEGQSLATAKNKKGFFVELTEAIFEKTKNLDENKFALIGKTIFNQLEEKEIMVFFNDSQLQKNIGNLGWDGSIKSYSPTAEGTTVLPDYLHINETNVGINKINLFIERNINHQITLEKEGKISEKIQLSYTNKSQVESYPFGSYKNYLRIYLPLGIGLNSVFINEQQQGDLWVPVDLKDVEIFEEYGKTVLGLYIEIPANSSKQIEFSYDLPQKLDLSKKINSYLLFIQKQSGEISNKYNLIFTYSDNFIPLRVLPNATIEGNHLIITEDLDRDKVFQIDLAR